jgi:hypothetical protein
MKNVYPVSPGGGESSGISFTGFACFVELVLAVCRDDFSCPSILQLMRLNFERFTSLLVSLTNPQFALIILLHYMQEFYAV